MRYRSTKYQIQPANGGEVMRVHLEKRANEHKLDDFEVSYPF